MGSVAQAVVEFDEAVDRAEHETCDGELDEVVDQEGHEVSEQQVATRPGLLSEESPAAPCGSSAGDQLVSISWSATISPFSTL